MVGVSVYGNENKEEAVERMANVNHGQLVSQEATVADVCEAPKQNSQLVDSCAQRSTHMGSMREVKGKDHFERGE